eukprot:TRINITY_DN66557_c11_g3_i1.p1 TRINITY_DN66557_c11_g3~~TRINITY_DN66557_c11_g3_i1.p1  ORF type:complete len:732 (-),score=250.37 TRINITY_DN66557_c11_g3_i1:654-2849(-)
MLSAASSGAAQPVEARVSEQVLVGGQGRAVLGLSHARRGVAAMSAQDSAATFGQESAGDVVLEEHDSEQHHQQQAQQRLQQQQEHLQQQQQQQQQQRREAVVSKRRGHARTQVRLTAYQVESSKSTSRRGSPLLSSHTTHRLQSAHTASICVALLASVAVFVLAVVDYNTDSGKFASTAACVRSATVEVVFITALFAALVVRTHMAVPVGSSMAFVWALFGVSVVLGVVCVSLVDVSRPVHACMPTVTVLSDLYVALVCVVLGHHLVLVCVQATWRWSRLDALLSLSACATVLCTFARLVLCRAGELSAALALAVSLLMSTLTAICMSVLLYARLRWALVDDRRNAAISPLASSMSGGRHITGTFDVPQDEQAVLDLIDNQEADDVVVTAAVHQGRHTGHSDSTGVASESRRVINQHRTTMSRTRASEAVGDAASMTEENVLAKQALAARRISRSRRSNRGSRGDPVQREEVVSPSHVSSQSFVTTPKQRSRSSRALDSPRNAQPAKAVTATKPAVRPTPSVPSHTQPAKVVTATKPTVRPTPAATTTTTTTTTVTVASVKGDNDNSSSANNNVQLPWTVSSHHTRRPSGATRTHRHPDMPRVDHSTLSPTTMFGNRFVERDAPLSPTQHKLLVLQQNWSASRSSPSSSHGNDDGNKSDADDHPSPRQSRSRASVVHRSRRSVVASRSRMLFTAAPVADSSSSSQRPDDDSSSHKNKKSISSSNHVNADDN